MNTTRNRAKVLAQFLRAAVQQLRAAGCCGHKTPALESIGSVAEELEVVAAHPDPDGAR